MQPGPGAGSRSTKPASAPAAQLPALLQQAVAFHREHHLPQAAALCEQILAIEPRHFDALHLLGLIAAQSGDPAAGVRLIGQAIEIDPHNPLAHCNRGLALQQARQLDAALRSYNRAIALNPSYAQAHLNRGNALRELAQPEAALASYERAIASRPELASAHVHRGVVLGELHRPQEALASLDRALALQPDVATTHCNRGNVLVRLKQFAAALASYEQAIALEPLLAEAYCNRGSLQSQLGEFATAVSSYDRAIEIRPDYAEACCNRAIALMALEQWPAALASCDQAIAISNSYAEAHFSRGVVLYQLKQLDAALASYDRAISCRPDYAEAYSNRGIVQRELYQLEAALASYDQALALRPDYAEAHLNRGNVLTELRRIPEALASFERALSSRARARSASLTPGSVEPAAGIAAGIAALCYNRALALLTAGDFANGWREYEWRRKIAGRASLRVTRESSKPYWLGEEPLAGRSILLHSEQGLGDTIQFCRYVKPVAQLGARVILEVQRPLVSLLRSLEGVACVLARDEALPEFDVCCSLMSLPRAMRTTLANIPREVPYLVADPARVRHWQERLGARHAPRIGLVWSGGFRPNQPELWAVNRRRNIPLAKFAPLGNPEVQFYSLQKGQPAEAELAELASRGWDGPRMVDLSRELSDFSDTAAVIANLDLVISVDTATAHLAGALGKPVWILSRFDSCWRWLLDRTDSPWYPSVRLYRQERYGEWDAVMQRVASDLRRFPA